MDCTVYDGIEAFAADTLELMTPRETENNMIISNTLRGLRGADTAGWFMAAVREGGSIRLIALMTPPHNVVVCEPSGPAADGAYAELAAALADSAIPAPGIMAEKALARRLADAYCARTGKPANIRGSLRLYRLDRVRETAPVPGALRKAGERDFYFLPYWQKSFYDDCGLGGGDIPAAAEFVKKRVNAGSLYLWEDGVPVSQAAMGRETYHGAIVSAVYTPPMFRGRGYATACVSTLSRRLLQEGYDYCALYTNIKNPISNSIYMKIGYCPACDFDEYRFV